MAVAGGRLCFWTKKRKEGIRQRQLCPFYRRWGSRRCGHSVVAPTGRCRRCGPVIEARWHVARNAFLEGAAGVADMLPLGRFKAVGRALA
jgi:hypothetical protein